jgi:hypothetical protein
MPDGSGWSSLGCPTRPWRRGDRILSVAAQTIAPQVMFSWDRPDILLIGSCPENDGFYVSRDDG